MASVNWSSYDTWMLVLPPNRPSESLLREITTIISSLHKPKSVCILGSTPEYRTICARFFNKVVLIDHSKEFYNLSSTLCIRNNDEQLINDNWIDSLENLPKKFDVILSHLTHGNIPFEDRPKFYRAISNSLTDEGFFIDYIFQPQPPGLTPNEIIDKFRDRPLNLRTINDFNSLALFQNHIIEELGCVDTTQIYNYLENSINDNRIRLLIEHTKIMTPVENRWDYCFDLTPTKLGYDENFKAFCKLAEPQNSPFNGAAYLQISRRRDGRKI